MGAGVSPRFVLRRAASAAERSGTPSAKAKGKAPSSASRSAEIRRSGNRSNCSRQHALLGSWPLHPYGGRSVSVFVETMPSFEEFFRACWAADPFPWQNELADRVVSTGWPSLLDVPTGLGKTAALDVFVWHLASQADGPPGERTAPTRAAFVIDRRLVVDSAFRRLRALTRTLDSSDLPVSMAVAQRLRSIGGTEFPLVVQRMRGGITWQAQWVRQPDQPAIVCGTVDQIGSRLLCRGYGSSASRMPIDAGLLGTDCVLIIDEAHLSSAMATTVSGIGQIEDRSPNSPLRGRSSRVVKMTATSPGADGDVLRVGGESADVSHPVAGPRLLARKRTVLIEVKRDDDVTTKLVDLGRVMATGTSVVVLVVCNTVKRARLVFDSLALSDQWDTQLLIGRCRDLERREAEPMWFDRAKADRAPRSAEDRPLILVSTQTVEVGVDLDVDSLITEVASADALVQRFGRVDRLGRVGETLSAIVACPAKLSEAPVYGPSAAETWAVLGEAATPFQWSLPKMPDFEALRGSLLAASTFDAGPLSFRELIDGAPQRRALFAAAAPAPVVVAPTLDCWARTSPIPDPDEAVGPYLHGVERLSPVVAVVWRAGNSAEELERSVQDVPVRSDELVEVPLLSFRNFLNPSKDAPDGEVVSDLESQSSNEAIEVRDRGEAVGVLVRSRSDISRDLRSIRPGDIVVLPSSGGGHDDGGWTGRPIGVVADIADVVDRRLVRLRLSYDVLGSFGLESPAISAALRPFDRIEADSDPSEIVSELLNQIKQAASRRQAHLLTLAAQVLLRDVQTFSEASTWTIGSAISYDRPTLVVGPVLAESDDQEMVRGLLLTMPRPENSEGSLNRDSGVDTFASEADDDGENGADSSLLPSVPVGVDLSLLRHSIDVGTRASVFAKNLGLPLGIVRTLAFAGFLHDLGKADVRFQAMLRRGDLASAEASVESFAELVAKSNIPMSDTSALRLATARSGWPGLRHEAISLALAQTWPEAEVPELVDRELAFYLVATHHGYGRPWFPADREDKVPSSITVRIEPQDISALTSGHGGVPVLLSANSDEGIMAFDQPDRCKSIRRSYGFWGLAFLEALLRLADMTVSEELGEQLLSGRR